MASQPVYNREFSTVFQDKSVKSSIVTGSSGSADPLIAGRAKHQLVIRRITVVITTSAAQSYTFRTNNGTPVILAVIANSAAVGVQTFEFGETGWELPAGEDLDLAMSGAGPGSLVFVDAHEIPERGAAMLPSQV